MKAGYGESGHCTGDSLSATRRDLGHAFIVCFSSEASARRHVVIDGEHHCKDEWNEETDWRNNDGL